MKFFIYLSWYYHFTLLLRIFLRLLQNLMFTWRFEITFDAIVFCFQIRRIRSLPGRDY